MYFKELKKTALLLLIIIGGINMVSAQIVRKIGDNPFTINKRAALEVESTTKGFLPPRMTKLQRDAIEMPAEGLLVWCTDCNKSTEPVSGEICAWVGTAWVPIAMPAKNYSVIIDGTAVASILRIDPISKQFKIGEKSTNSITVHFDVTKAGTYNFVFDSVTGATTGLKMIPMSGSWSSTGEQTVTFFINGTPETSLEGNYFAGSGMTKALETGPIAESDAVFTATNIGAISEALKIGVNSSSATIKVDLNVTKAGNYNFVPIRSGATEGLSMDSKSGTFLNAGPQTLYFTISGTPTGSSAGNTFTIPGGDLKTGTITKRALTADNITIPPFEVGKTGSANVFDNVTIGGERADASKVNISQVGVSPINSNLRLNVTTGQVEAGNNADKLAVGSYTLTYRVTDKTDSENSADRTVNVTVNKKKIVAPDKTLIFQEGGRGSVNVLEGAAIGGKPAAQGNVDVSQVGPATNDRLRLNNSETYGLVEAGYLGRGTFGIGTKRYTLPEGTHTLKYRVTDKTDPTNSADGTVTVIVKKKIAAPDIRLTFEYGNQKTVNVLSDARIDGNQATESSVVVSKVTTTNANLDFSVQSMAPFAPVFRYGDVDAGPWYARLQNYYYLPVGTHTLVYRVAEKADLTNYTDGTVTVTVTAARQTSKYKASDDSKAGSVTYWTNTERTEKNTISLPRGEEGGGWFNGPPAPYYIPEYYGPASCMSFDNYGIVSDTNNAIPCD